MLSRSLRCLALTAGLVVALAASAEDKKEDGFKPLFNGKDLTGFKAVIGGKAGELAPTFTVKDGAIVTKGGPAGYLVTEKSYKNYTLKYDWKFVTELKPEDPKVNSGCLLHVQGLPEKGSWPKSVEIQGLNRDMGRLIGVGGVKGTFTEDADLRKQAVKPLGEWNEVEAVCKDGMITASINGKKIAQGKAEITEGPIGWQAEGTEIHFRNIRIKEDK